MIIVFVLIFALLLVPSQTYSRDFHENYLSKDVCNAIKGSFILMIFISHFSQYSNMKTSQLDLAWWNCRVFLGQCVVAMFLFYSGYGVMESIMSKGSAYVKTFLQRRVLNVWRAWVVSQCIFLVANSIGASVGLRIKNPYMDFPHSLIAWSSQGNDNWYIFDILYLYIITYISFQVFKNRHYLALAAVTLFSLGFIVLLKSYANLPAYWFNSLLCYPLGLCFSLKRSKLEPLLRKNLYYCISLVGAIAGFLFCHSRWGDRLLFYEMTVMLFSVVVLLMTMKFSPRNSFLVYCGRHLSSLFLMHRLPMRLLQYTPIAENRYVYFLVSIVLAFLCANLFEKFCTFLCESVACMFEKTDSKTNGIYYNFQKNSYLFSELVKRDFKQKYKRTVLGMWWSILLPLLTLFVMKMVFTQFFGRNTPHYTTYLFCGNLVFSYFKESTNGGMNALMANRGIISKVNVPKYMFLLSKNVSALINFSLTLCVFFLFAGIDHIHFGSHFIMLVYPIGCLVVFNIGMGLILSALFVFFRDIGYLYDVFTLLLMYMSAIFYQVDRYSATVQRLFLCNPVYCYIKYFRVVVLEGNVPSLAYHGLCVFYALFAMAIGGFIYKKYNHKFLYYM